MAIPEFVTVPKEIRDTIQPVHRNRYTDAENPLVKALQGGETVFIETTSRKLAGLYQQARRRNFTMTLRQGLNGETAGCYVWWEPKTEGAS